MLHPKFLLIFALMIFSKCSGYRILGIFPLESKSHMMMFESIMKRLTKCGHQVDVMSTFPLKKSYPNYTDIVIPPSEEGLVNNIDYNKLMTISKNSLTSFIAKILGNNVCERVLASPPMQRLIKNPPTDPPYDLLLVEVCSADCFMAFGPYLKVPMIGITSSLAFPWVNDYVANPENLAFIGNSLLGQEYDMNLWNRVYNFIYTVYTKWYYNYLTSTQNDILKKHFGPDVEEVQQLRKKLAMIFANSHISLNEPKPITPAFVEVGGLHVGVDDAEVPADLQKWMNESINGFVYFTFGSMINIETFPEQILQIFYKSFSKISPVRVLMKVSNPQLLPPGLPMNIRTFKWTPQLEVLKHKNTRAFITHGGLMSTQEAISCAVPMIGMPFFSDQFSNTDFYVKKKIAVRLDVNEITENNLNHALHEVLHNPIIRKAAKEISARFLDRPLKPLDEVCYWVQYIIRYGEKAVRSAALDFSWWQLALLDVYCILFLLALKVILILIFLYRYLFKIIYCKLMNILKSKKE